MAKLAQNILQVSLISGELGPASARRKKQRTLQIEGSTETHARGMYVRVYKYGRPKVKEIIEINVLRPDWQIGVVK